MPWPKVIMSHTPYAYTMNDPVNFTDLLGLKAMSQLSSDDDWSVGVGQMDYVEGEGWQWFSNHTSGISSGNTGSSGISQVGPTAEDKDDYEKARKNGETTDTFHEWYRKQMVELRRSGYLYGSRQEAISNGHLFSSKKVQKWRKKTSLESIIVSGYDDGSEPLYEVIIINESYWETEYEVSGVNWAGRRDFIDEFPTYYESGPYSVSGYKDMYLPAKGVGISGGIRGQASAKIYLSNGVNYAHVTAYANTHSTRTGKVSFGGYVEVILDGNVVSITNLQAQNLGETFGPSGLYYVGAADVPLPVYNAADVIIRVNIGYNYQNNKGGASPWPATRGFDIQLVTKP
jgi:hypothetical protein